MNADSAFRMGYTHSVCQDYALARSGPCAYALVFDGCSLSRDMDIGARLLVRIADVILCTNGGKGPTELKNHRENYHAEVIRKAFETGSHLGLDESATDATLLTIVSAGEHWGAAVAGDDVVVACKRTGERSITPITYTEEYPAYLSYALDDDRKASFVMRETNRRRLEHWSVSSDGEVISYEVSEECANAPPLWIEGNGSDDCWVAARTLSSDRLCITEIGRFPAAIVSKPSFCGTDIAVTTQGLYVRGRLRHSNPNVHLALTPRLGHLIAATLISGRIGLRDLTEDRDIEAPFEAAALMSYDDRLYVRSGEQVSEIFWSELPAGIQASFRLLANVLPNATELLEGVAFQSILGASHALLFPRSGACYTVRLRELDRYRIVDARFDGGVLVVLGELAGSYAEFLFRFSPDYGEYDLRTAMDVGPASINFATLDTGVCLRLLGSGDLEVFSNRRGDAALSVIPDAGLGASQLCKSGGQALIANDDTLYALTSRASAPL